MNDERRALPIVPARPIFGERPGWMRRHEFDGSYIVASIDTDDGYKCHTIRWENGTGWAVVIDHDATQRWIVAAIFLKPLKKGDISRARARGLRQMRLDAQLTARAAAPPAP